MNISLFVSLALFVSFSDAFSSASSALPKPTLVVGSTGKVGRLVVKQLLEEKKKVRDMMIVL